MNTYIYTIILTGFLISPLRVFAQSQGPLNPATTSNDNTGGNNAWLNNGNTISTNNSYATATNLISNYLNVSNFGFSIPTTSSVLGILVEVERKAAPVNVVAAGSWTTFTNPAYVSGTATSNYGSTSYSYNLPVASTTNSRRLLVVTIGIENPDNVGAANPSITFGTVTYNGVAMTQATSSSLASATTSNYVAIYYLTESSLPATIGSRNLVINKTINGELSGGSVSPGEFVEIVGVNTFTDVNQSNPISAVSQTSTTSPITSPALNNIRVGDYIVAATFNNTSSVGGGSVTQGTGYTENFEVSYNNTSGATSGALLEVESRSLAGVTGTPTVTASVTAAGASRLEMGAIAINAARVYDNSVRLLNSSGVQVGSNYAITPANSLPNAWPDVDTYQSYGGSSNLWGATWTPAEINSPNFGVSFQANEAFSIASVDNIRITVSYSTTLGLSLQSFSLTKTNEQVVSLISYNMDDSKNYQITLEKAMDGFNFFSIEKILTKGTSVMQSLSLTDANPSYGINYYRIRIDEIDKEASTQYSMVKQIDFGNENLLEVHVYPNPVVDFLIVESYQKITSINLFDVTGRNIAKEIISTDTNKFKIEGLKVKGLYTLIVNTNLGVITKKIIIN